jgi:hypothetical protein
VVAIEVEEGTGLPTYACAILSKGRCAKDGELAKVKSEVTGSLTLELSCTTPTKAVSAFHACHFASSQVVCVHSCIHHSGL